jgi:hypothetical protein
MSLRCFVIVLLSAVLTDAFGVTFQSKESNYSFVIPPGWEEIPKEMLDETSERVANVTGTKRLIYETGFQIAGKRNLEPPYILIPVMSKLDKGGLPPNALELLYESYTKHLTASVEEHSKTFSDYLSSPSFEMPYLDKEKRMIAISMKGNYSGKDMRSLVAQFVGKNSIVQINFVTLESDYLKYNLAFEGLITSFRFDEPFIPQSLKNRMVDKAITSIMAGIILALIVSAFFGIRKWIRNKQ